MLVASRSSVPVYCMRRVSGCSRMVAGTPVATPHRTDSPRKSTSSWSAAATDVGGRCGCGGVVAVVAAAAVMPWRGVEDAAEGRAACRGLGAGLGPAGRPTGTRGRGRQRGCSSSSGGHGTCSRADCGEKGMGAGVAGRRIDV